MRLSFLIAFRYIFSKKRKTFINFLSYFSVASLSVGTAAMIIVLSVFNGLESTLKSIYEDFDPDLKIKNVNQKYFDNDLREEILSVEGVESVSGVLENKALLRHDEKEVVCFIKGVDNNFAEQERIVNNITDGSFSFKQNNLEHAVVGRGIKYSLGLNSSSDFQNIQVYALKGSAKLNPNILRNNVYSQKSIKTAGVFAIENGFDNGFVFTSLEFAQELFDKNNKLSSYEIKLYNKHSTSKTKAQIAKKIGPDFDVLTFAEQREGLFKILKTEKVVVYIVFSLILILSSMNIYFLLTMMTVEKRKDMLVLLSLGIKNNQIKKIFVLQGMIIGCLGVFLGVIIGLILSTIQENFGIIKINLTSSILEAYPIKTNPWDLIIVASIVILVSVFASLFPSITSTPVKDFSTSNKLVL